MMQRCRHVLVSHTTAIFRQDCQVPLFLGCLLSTELFAHIKNYSRLIYTTTRASDCHIFVFFLDNFSQELDFFVNLPFRFACRTEH